MRTKTKLLGAASAFIAASAVSGLAAASDGSGDGLVDDVHVGGRLEFDAAYVDGEDFGDDGFARTESRRARIGVHGTMGPRVAYQLEAAIDERNDVDIEDAFIELRGASAAIVIGQFREPVSLNQQTFSPFLSSMERAAFTEAFGFERRAGIALRTGGDNWTLIGGAFGDNVSNAEAARDESYAVALRGTYAPINTETMVVQIGGSVRYRDAADDGLFSYSARPNAHLAPSYVGDGGVGFADSDLFLGVEAAGVFGPLHVAAEYGWLDAEGLVTDATFQGAYLEAGYFLTGETRNLNAARGAFGRNDVRAPITEGGMGAFEVRGRIDFLDLNDGAVNLGEQVSYTVGLNWHATNYLRILGEYVYADIDDSPAALGADGEVNAVQVRTAVDW